MISDAELRSRRSNVGGETTEYSVPPPGVDTRYHAGRLRRGSRPIDLLNEHPTNIREVLSIRRRVAGWYADNVGA